MPDNNQKKSHVETLRAEAEHASLAFHDAILAGMDFQEAELKYLRPIRLQIELAIEQNIESIELKQILTNFNQVVKESDKTAVGTLTTQARFEEIIQTLEAQDENYQEILIDLRGIVHGTKPKEDALYWYREMAAEFAQNKAEEYLREAVTELNSGNPMLAYQRLQAASNLYYLTDQMIQKINNFLTTYVRPNLERIEQARRNLQRVLYATSIEEAIDLYNKALNSDTGWPSFETQLLQQTNKNTLSLDNALVENAREFVYYQIEQEAKTKTQLLSDPNQWKVIQVYVSFQDIHRLEKLLNWGDGHLRSIYEKPLNRILAMLHNEKTVPSEIQRLEKEHIFISYSHRDKDIMHRVRNSLYEKGFSAWVDEHIVPGTDSWKRAIQDAIEVSKCLIVILTPEAKQSKWVENELDYAFIHKKTIFPILARGSEQEAVMFGYTLSQRIDIRQEDSYELEISKMIATINNQFSH